VKEAVTMRRCLPAVILLAMGAPALGNGGEPINPVELRQGWQIVSFPILEPMLLDDFDLLTTAVSPVSERRTFAEASAPPDPWVESQLWWYDTDTQGYQTLALGQSVVPNRGYWVYLYRAEPLHMVPTYNVTEFWATQVGFGRLMDALGNEYPGTYAMDYYIGEQDTICGIPCLGRYITEGPLDGGDPYYGWLEWWTHDSMGLWQVGGEYFVEGTSARLDPPLLWPNRMYPGELHSQTVIVSDECGGAGYPVVCGMWLLGTEVVNSIAGDLTCLKLEEMYMWPDESVDRSLTWLGPSLGEVRRLHWAEGYLWGVEEVVDWAVFNGLSPGVKRPSSRRYGARAPLLTR
jgi:hypothetical protein